MSKDQSNFSKWIVVTSINEPTKQLDKLTNEKEFQLLVIADLKTNKTWLHENKKTIFLSVNNQTNLHYSILTTTPFNSYTRKNIGYLYAIQNGAQFIYDTDDDNEPLTNLIDYFDFNEFKTELEYDRNSPSIINPYAHFGQPTIWPRGFSLSEINKKLYNDYILVEKPTSIIQQSVVNGDPDVDAIFRLTKSLDYKRIDIRFDSSSPSVRIPMFKLTPFNSQNTLFHYKAFWALYLPYTVSFRLTDIWRSYWAQRLMWLLDSTVSFLGPNAYQLRNSHSYLSDYKQEKAMFIQTKDLIQFLYTWKCKFRSFYQCVIDLSEQMALNQFWDMKEVAGIKNWLKDLDFISYIEPKIINFNYETSELNINDYFLKNNNNKLGVQIRYTPRFETFIDLDNYYGNGEEKMKSLEKLETINYFIDYCQSNYKLEYNLNSLNKFREIQDLTLLVTFKNEPILKNLIFLKKFYQSYFKNIVFCGRNIKVIKQKEKHLKEFDSFTLIEINNSSGFEYNCMSNLIDINLKTTGILVISGNDQLLKYWKLNLTNISTWLPLDCSKIEILKKLNQYIDLKSIRFINATPEIYYISKSLFNKFNSLSKLFYKNKILNELTVATIFNDIADGSISQDCTNTNTNMILDNVIKKVNITNQIDVCQFFIQDKLKYF